MKKEDNYSLLVHIEHSKPIEVNDFVTSVRAINDLFQSYCRKNGRTKDECEGKLYISKIEEGSIDIILQHMIDLALPLFGEFNVVCDFAKHLKSIYEYFIKGDGEKPILTVQECKDYSKMVTPIINDAKAKMLIGAIQGENKGTIIQNFYLNKTESNAIQNVMTNEITDIENLPEQNLTHKNVLLEIFQAVLKDANKKGNKGIIDTINPGASYPLLFENDDLRKEILFSDFNPANVVYYVDVEVMTTSGKIRAYKVVRLHDVVEK